MAAGGDDDGSATVGVLGDGGRCFATVCTEVQASAFSSTVLQRV